MAGWGCYKAQSGEKLFYMEFHGTVTAKTKEEAIAFLKSKISVEGGYSISAEEYETH